MGELVKARRARGMSQTDVARKMCVVPSAVSLLETRWRDGGSITLHKLAQYADAIDAELKVQVTLR